MTSKINITDIVYDHLGTLRDASSGRISRSDIIVFYGIPAVIGGCFAWFDPTFDDNSVAVIIAALAIFAGLLINVLVLLYTVKEVGPTKKDSAVQIQLIKEVNANLLYSIVIALGSIIFLCVEPFTKGLLQRLLLAFSFSANANFILTLLMALKRIRTLLFLRFKPQAPTSDDPGPES